MLQTIPKTRKIGKIEGFTSITIKTGADILTFCQFCT